jgi:hypothetical protein
MRPVFRSLADTMDAPIMAETNERRVVRNRPDII